MGFPGLAVLGGYLTAARPRNIYPWVLSGFDRATTSRGHVLTNMARRAWGLDGVLEVVSSSGRGTTVAGRVPLAVPELIH